jgi:benzoyl-CoA reductase/2-hydroxyglutaryl-CoA dehydratase subunit BcrC/BadD/HgdB
MFEIKATKDLMNIMKSYFQSFQNGKPVAWCTSVGPAELLRSFGFEVYFPENHGALLGATRKAEDYIPEAIKAGFSGHVCSYTTSDIGAFLSGETPLTKHYGIPGIPKPDLIVYNTNQCREVEDWFSYYGRAYGCPVAGITPPKHLDEVKEEDIAYVSNQFKSIIPIAEKASGMAFDLGRFKETTRLSKEASILWQKVLNTSSSKPAPISFFDGTIHMGPIVVLRGTQIAVDYYKLLLKELEGKIFGGEKGFHSEKQRIFWDGMPIWGKLRMLSNLFIENHTSVVASTYCNSWIFDTLDPEHPFESSALAYTGIFINRSEKAKMAQLKKWATDFKIDGMIFHDSKTCFHNSNSRFGLPSRFKDETGIPTMVIEGDLNDLRFFSEGQTITKIETFIEQLGSYKKEVVF